MDVLNWFMLAVFVIVVAVLIPIARHWYRRHQAAKLADDLLATVLKDKDSFRR